MSDPVLSIGPGGRYAVFDEIAAGGTASVHLGLLRGQAGFSRTVAIKRLYPQFAKDEDVVAMLVDEARLASRIASSNVVPVLEVVCEAGEVFLVLEYVHGLSLSRLVRIAAKKKADGDADPIPVRVAAAIVCGALAGLHAAHEARGSDGEPLGIVHRDVSPPNVLVGADGVARVLDFGIAKARGRSRTTREGLIKGKVAYMPPEQIQGKAIDRRADLYAAGIVLWELLTLERLFQAGDDAALVHAALTQAIPPPGTIAPAVPEGLDAVVARALEREPDARFSTAKEMAAAIEGATPIATAAEVAAWIESLGGAQLAALSATAAKVSASADAPRPKESASPPAAPADDPRRRGGWKVGAVVAGVGAALAVVVIAVARASSEDVPSRAEDELAVSSAPRAVQLAPSGSAESAVPAPRPVPVSSARGEASAIKPGEEPAMRPRPAATLTPAQEADCKPPFWIDAAGHKHYKSQCF